MIVETASWMIVNYIPIKSWDEKDKRLFFAKTIQKHTYERDEEEKVYSALFPIEGPKSQVSELVYGAFSPRKEEYKSLLERVLEKS